MRTTPPAKEHAERLMPRAPVTDSQWKPIKQALKAVDVDADKVTVSVARYFGPKGPPDTQSPYELRRGLPILAWLSAADLYTRQTQPTAKQLVQRQTHGIKLCNDLLIWLDDFDNYTHHDSKTDWLRFPRLTDLTLRADEALDELAAELVRCRDELRTERSRRGMNNNRPHIQFWEELEQIWHNNVSSDVKSRNQHKIRFLRTCTEPFFPEVITDDDRTISAFVEGRSARSSSGK